MLQVPDQDKRVYHAFSVGPSSFDTDSSADNANGSGENSIRCLVISDPSTEKAAASVCVAAGQLQDTHTQGRAHLLEHAVFLGTKQFPVENEYDAFLSQHGGHSNAYTDLEKTCYYCDVSPQCLQETVQRLASCLKEPLFQAEALERELQAVDSEHGKNAQSDHWRAMQLSKMVLGGIVESTSEKSVTATLDLPHPYAGFGTGNLQSLLGDTAAEGKQARVQALQQAVQEFFDDYYTASNLTVTVLGAEPIETLQSWVEAAFVNWRPTVAPVPPVPPLDTTLLPKQVLYLPVRPVRSVELQWIWPALKDQYKTKPGRVLSHLVGHEGPGSLLAALRKRQWAQELYADDQSKSGTAFSAFLVNIELTELGFANAQKVVQMVYHYLSLLQDLPTWVHSELKTTAETQFRFLSQRDPVDTVSSLSSQMHDYPVEHYLSGPYKVFQDFDAQATKALQDLLVPSNMLVLLAAPEYAERIPESQLQTDPWYGTKYQVVTPDWSCLNDNNMDASQFADLHLPKPNDMLATRFDLMSLSPEWQNVANPHNVLPTCLVDSSQMRLWYQPDLIFRQPKVNAMFLFRMNLQESPRRAVLAALWAEVMHEICNEAFSYEASMAGLHGDFSAASAGLELSVSGYHDKADLLLQKMTQALQNMPSELDETMVARIRTKLQEQYLAFLVGQPYQHAMHVADLVLEESKSSIQDRLQEMETVDADDLRVFSKEVLKTVSMEALIHGNVTAETAVKWSQALLDSIQAQPALKPRPHRVVQLPHTTPTVIQQKAWNDQDENSVLYNLFQVGLVDTRTNAMLSVLNHLLREPAYNQLRTEEQLGYIVYSSIKTNHRVKGWQLLIQSDQYDPLHMQASVDTFLQGYRTKLVQMTDEVYQTNVQAVCQNLLEKSKNLSEESSKLWRVVCNQTYQWRRLEEIAAAAANVKKSEILIFFDKYIADNSPHQRKLAIEWYGCNKEVEIAEEFEPKEFCRVQSLYPAHGKVDITIPKDTSQTSTSE